MIPLWPSKAANDGAEGAEVAEAGQVRVDSPDTVVADVGPGTLVDGAAPKPNLRPARPQLQRNQIQPNPPAQTPPPTTNQPSQPPDSLSLAQLRRIVSEIHGTEAIAYDFVYSDTGPHAEEIDEWFVYQFWQWVRLNAAQRAFESQWEQLAGGRTSEAPWEEASAETRTKFVQQALDGVSSTEPAFRANAVGRLVYLVLGRWADTAGLVQLQLDRSKIRTVATQGQLDAMKSGVKMLAELGGIPVIWTALCDTYETLRADEPLRLQGISPQEAQDLLINLMTIMYVCIQETLNDPAELNDVHEILCMFQYVPLISGIVADPGKTLLLLWKSILLVFGGTDKIEETKEALRETSGDDQNKEIITASPLDYHVFRQELTSKYPAYIPPQSAIPLEADNTSILPPLPNHPTRNNGSNGILPAPPGAQSGGASILHQPVHIATPAPSPPPSPAVGGKGGKKQNYQTNQNFPFMYPPLDATSNSAGGKGGAGLQDALVGRKWEGSDVPASILEAGELFSKRVRMTRATRQLWEERERFLKFERGWDPSDDDIDDLNLDTLSPEDDIDDDKLLEKIEERRKKAQGRGIDRGPNPNLDESIVRRLEAVEAFYEATLPQLQSLIIVLMKGVLQNVTACITLSANGQQHPGVPGPGNNPRVNGNGPPLNRSHDSSVGNHGSAVSDNNDPSLEELDAARSREIESKAATGIILLLLKWLKVSLLKLFAHQDIQQAVDSKTDRLEHSFFYFCNHRANPSNKMVREPTEIDSPDDESDDAVAPPPIKRRRSPSPQVPTQYSEQAANTEGEAPTRPEVDELGLPLNPLPKEPITDFSRRNFFALINYLRIMQKICKNKSHRNLLLVQYKSSNIIRKTLKIPQPELRLYTLKLFKNQVPYCGRKWRQSNMRVITAVYLHCRPELRDEWLAGSDVDADIEEALPLEQALRSLTHWFNVRRHPEQMAPEIRAALQDERDFFKRELDKLEIWNEINGAGGESANGEWEHPPGPMAGWG
ncbi:hypothetical protein DL771_004395 [Monosporascus sp. 5C6A]|nr:hypothetical protein DL771_004395 [Monosporascus sp. 5C6A]